MIPNGLQEVVLRLARHFLNVAQQYVTLNSGGRSAALDRVTRQWHDDCHQVFETLDNVWALSATSREAAEICIAFARLVELGSRLISPETWAEWSECGWQLAERLNDPLAAAVCRGNLASALTKLDRRPEAIEHYRAVIESLARIDGAGGPSWRAQYFASLAAEAAREYDPESAARWIALAETSDDAHTRCRMAVLRGRTAHDRGAYDEAERIFSGEAVPLAKGHNCGTCLAVSLYHLGHTLNVAGNSSEGRCQLRHALGTYADNFHIRSAIIIGDELLRLELTDDEAVQLVDEFRRCIERTGSLVEGCEDERVRIDLENDLGKVHFQLSTCWSKLNRCDWMIESIIKGRKLNPFLRQDHEKYLERLEADPAKAEGAQTLRQIYTLMALRLESEQERDWAQVVAAEALAAILFADLRFPSEAICLASFALVTAVNLGHLEPARHLNGYWQQWCTDEDQWCAGVQLLGVTELESGQRDSIDPDSSAAVELLFDRLSHEDQDRLRRRFTARSPSGADDSHI